MGPLMCKVKLTCVSSLQASPTTAVAQSMISWPNLQNSIVLILVVLFKTESEGHDELAECGKNRERHFTWFEIAALTIPMSSALLFSEEVGNAIFVIKTASVKNKVLTYHFKPKLFFQRTDLYVK